MRSVSVLALLLVAGSLRAQVGLHQGKPDTPPPPNPRASSQPTDAISQLEAISGQKIDRTRVDTRFRPPKAPPRSPTPDQQAMALLGGLLGGLLTQALAPSTPVGSSPAEQARLEAERQAALQRQQAELAAWAQGYTQRMGALLEQQRQQRSLRDQASFEALRASLSDGWDQGAPSAGGGLVGALSDPTPRVDLQAKVDLRVTEAGVPSLLRHASGARRSQILSVKDVLQRREAARARLEAMMAENRDLRLLGRRFYELEARFAQLRQEAERQSAQGRALQRELDLWGWRIEQASQACLERGLSLFADILLPKGTEAGLKRLQKNPKRWKETVESLANLNEFSEFASGLVDRYDAAGQALDWAQAKRNLLKDLDFLASNAVHLTSKLEPVTLHWQVGKALLGTGLDLATEVDGWGAILEREGDVALLLQKQKALQPRLEAVVRELQTHRAQLAQRLGVKPEDLLPPPSRPDPLGYPVPPL